MATALSSISMLAAYFALMAFRHAKGHDGQFHHGVRLDTTKPLNIAHRGSSGTFPEHTVEAYRRGIADGADVIECDVVLSRDLQPLCLHEPWISSITDLESHADLATRPKRTAYIDNHNGNVTDWFTIDFTLAELKRLKLRQRFDFRNQEIDGDFFITSLAEYIAVAKAETSRTVGLYPEVKQPDWFNSVLNGTRIEDILLAALADAGYSKSDDPCFVQTFSEESAFYMTGVTSLPVVMLYDDSWEGKLESLVEHDIYGVGVWKENIARFYSPANGYKNWITGTTSLVADAHALGLKVHVYTFRNEDQYLAWDFQQDPMEEYKYFLDKEIDGLFTDFPSTLARYLAMRYPDEEPCSNNGRDVMGGGSGDRMWLFLIASMICNIMVSAW